MLKRWWLASKQPTAYAIFQTLKACRPKTNVVRLATENATSVIISIIIIIIVVVVISINVQKHAAGLIPTKVGLRSQWLRVCNIVVMPTTPSLIRFIIVTSSLNVETGNNVTISIRIAQAIAAVVFVVVVRYMPWRMSIVWFISLAASTPCSAVT